MVRTRGEAAAAGSSALVRYADDFVIVFERGRRSQGRRRAAEAIRASTGCTLHPEKTRLVRFDGRTTASRRKRRAAPATFDLLGFTHFWGMSRKGAWVVKRKTAKDRFSRTLKRIAEWCSANRHRPIKEQHVMLARKLRGHYAYFGITGQRPCAERAASTRALHLAPLARPTVLEERVDVVIE